LPPQHRRPDAQAGRQGSVFPAVILSGLAAVTLQAARAPAPRFGSARLRKSRSRETWSKKATGVIPAAPTTSRYFTRYVIKIKTPLNSENSDKHVVYSVKISRTVAPMHQRHDADTTAANRRLPIDHATGHKVSTERVSSHHK